MSRHHRRGNSLPNALQQSRVYRLDARPINGQILSSENVDVLLERWTRILPHSVQEEGTDLILLPPTVHLDLSRLRGYADDGIAMEAIETFFCGAYQQRLQRRGDREPRLSRKCWLRSVKIANVGTVEVVEDWMKILIQFGGPFLEEIVLKDIVFHSSIVNVLGCDGAAKYASTIHIRSKYFSNEEMTAVSNAIFNRMTEFKSNRRVTSEQDQRRLDVWYRICRTGDAMSPPPCILRQTQPSASATTGTVKMTEALDGRQHQRNPLNLWMTGVPLHQLCKISLYRVVLTPRTVGLLTKSLRSESSCCKDFRVTECGTMTGINATSMVLDSLVANGLLHNRSIETLFFNKLGGTLLPSISLLLGLNRTIRHLQLWSNAMRDDMAIRIAKGLSVNTGLRRLSVPHNHFSTIGMQILCAAAKQQGRLQELDLSENDLHSDVRYILNHIVSQSRTLPSTNIGSCLTALRLQSTQLKDEGACAIAWVLLGVSNDGSSGCTALRTLNLADNGIGVRGGVALAEALQQNQSLQRLDLSLNHFSLKIVDAFLETLSLYNYTLFELDVCPDSDGQMMMEDEGGRFRSKYHYRSLQEFNSRLMLVQRYLLCNQCGRYLLRDSNDVAASRGGGGAEVPLGIWPHVLRACAAKRYPTSMSICRSSSQTLPLNYELLRYFVSNKPELFQTQSSQAVQEEEGDCVSDGEFTVYSC